MLFYIIIYSIIAIKKKPDIQSGYMMAVKSYKCMKKKCLIQKKFGLNFIISVIYIGIYCRNYAAMNVLEKYFSIVLK
ncbi:MAG: hypothetical protein IKP65_06510 [Alphaproteobacteria bacterium]|nr:hypothetical protein [Alphaproteobacteria bacterium]